MEIKIIASSSKGNCYLLTTKNTKILLEAGIQFSQIKKELDYDLSIDGVLISHEHKDHSKATKDLMLAGIEVYMSAGTASKLKLSGHRLNIIESKKIVKIGDLNILPFDLHHDCAEPLGFLIADGKEKLLFITDTGAIGYKFEGLTTIMIECNHDIEILQSHVLQGKVSESHGKRVSESHLSLQKVVGYLEDIDKSRLQIVCLMHLSGGNIDEKKARSEVAKVTGAKIIVCEE